MKRTLFVIVLCIAVAAYGYGRLSRSWSHDELLAESDFVGVLEPLSNEPVKDEFTIEISDGHKITYKGVNTRFRIDMIFKTDGKATKDLTVLHFSEEGAASVANGPNFIYFPIGSLEYEKRLIRDGKQVGTMHIPRGTPFVLSFLKRRADGRYEPVTGQEDPDESFYELTPPFFPYL